MEFEPANGGFADSPWKRVLLVRLAFTTALLAVLGRFAYLSCSVCTHHASFVLNDLDRSELRWELPFAGYCAPKVSSMR